MKALDDIRNYFSPNHASSLERKLVLKLDVFILTFCCLAYFTNYMDRSSITQAYVSGMKEDLGFEGAQLTTVTTLYAVGYLIGIVPNNLLLTYFRPGIFFPVMITAWSALTMANAAARSPEDLMAIRFFQGYFESCIFAGTQFILGSWYTKRELGQRTGLFTASGLAGGMFGGFIQTGIHSSMDGLGGLPGWKWLFLILGIITIPVAIYGYFFFPDTPYTTTAFYFSEEEVRLACQRVPLAERGGESIVSKSFVTRLLTSRYFYGFCILWILGNCSESQGNQSLLNLYMQAQDPEAGYTVSQLNNWPTGVQAVGIVSTLVWAIGTDIWGGRWLSGYFVAVTCIGDAAIVLVATSGKSAVNEQAAVLAAYFWSGAIYCIQATFFAWANESTRNETSPFRACLIGCMNAAGNCFQAWWPLIFYRADDAPNFTKGMYALLGVGVLMAVWTTVLLYFDRRMAAKTTVMQVIDGQVPSGDGVEGRPPSADRKGSISKV